MVMLDVSFCAGNTDQDVKNYISVSNCIFVLSYLSVIVWAECCPVVPTWSCWMYRSVRASRTKMSRITCLSLIVCLFCLFFFFFFLVPQLYLWGSPFLDEIFAYVTVF